LRLSGVSKAGVGRGKARRTHEASFFTREQKFTPTTLFPGEQSFRASFTIDADAPLSYAGEDAAITYTLTVHVAIPWWLDCKACFDIPVVMAPVRIDNPYPKMFANHDDPRPLLAHEPFVDLSLDATHVAAGEMLTGSFSLGNLKRKRI